MKKLSEILDITIDLFIIYSEIKINYKLIKDDLINLPNYYCIKKFNLEIKQVETFDMWQKEEYQFIIVEKKKDYVFKRVSPKKIKLFKRAVNKLKKIIK